MFALNLSIERTHEGKFHVAAHCSLMERPVPLTPDFDTPDAALAHLAKVCGRST